MMTHLFIVLRRNCGQVAYLFKIGKATKTLFSKNEGYLQQQLSLLTWEKQLKGRFIFNHVWEETAKDKLMMKPKTGNRTVGKTFKLAILVGNK